MKDIDELARVANNMTEQEWADHKVKASKMYAQRVADMKDDRKSVNCGHCHGQGFNRERLPKGMIGRGHEIPCRNCLGEGRILWSRLFPQTNEEK